VVVKISGGGAKRNRKLSVLVSSEFLVIFEKKE
jgi:hypothetical protein